ncbi:MAG TPA: helical backbone metal receptor [Thermoanaerobaculia bacterium]|nr:helical backbone metal receptor [Thermoanaerobaculia bacterium]
MIDALGRKFDFPQPPRRVVSLVPSLTETLFALGAGDAVAGITDYCIFPEGIDRPRVGGTKNPSIERIRALAPDLVYVNLEENLERHADAIAEFAPIFATEPKSVDDVVSLIETLGAIHHRAARARTLIDMLNASRRPRAAFTFAVPIWKSPWMWCGGDTYVSDLVETAGGRNVLREAKRYPTIDLTAVLALEPDVVFLPDEPYAFTPEDAAGIEARVIGPFPGHLLTWHGVRTIEGLQFLAGWGSGL